MGNPWIFKQIDTYLQTGKEEEPPTISQRLAVIKEHLKMSVEEKGEFIAIREMRKQICWYIKNLKDSSRVRQVINHLETENEVIECLEEYFKSL